MNNIFHFIKNDLQEELLPLQRIVLKLLYGVPLDDSLFNVKLKDALATKDVGTFTENTCMKYLFEQRRSNKPIFDLTNRRKETEVAHLFLGRRGTKSTLGALIALYEAMRLVEDEEGGKEVNYYFPNITALELSVNTISTLLDKMGHPYSLDGSRISLGTAMKEVVSINFLRGPIQITNRAAITLADDLEVRPRSAECPPYRLDFEHAILQAEVQLYQKVTGKFITLSTVPYVTDDFARNNTESLLLSLCSAEMNPDISPDFLAKSLETLGINSFAQEYGAPKVR